eukprot:13662981-Alexandrium_andersonii.AAC.1
MVGPTNNQQKQHRNQHKQTIPTTATTHPITNNTSCQRQQHTYSHTNAHHNRKGGAAKNNKACAIGNALAPPDTSTPRKQR